MERKTGGKDKMIGMLGPKQFWIPKYFVYEKMCNQIKRLVRKFGDIGDFTAFPKFKVCTDVEEYSLTH